jgi:hypothetical protein
MDGIRGSFKDANYTVRLLQPGDSLLIEVVDEPETPEPEPVADELFERLADGTRMECDNCKHGGAEKIVCSNPDPTCRRTKDEDSRGVRGNSHSGWEPIEPTPTLDDALRTGTAEEIVAAIKAKAAVNRSSLASVLAVALTDAHKASWQHHLGDVHGVVQTIFLRGFARVPLTAMIVHLDTGTRDSGVAYTVGKFIELRDRLDLFGGESDD